MSDKRFPATPKRLRDARERGEVPQSSDLTGSAAFIGALVGLGASLSLVPGATRALWDQAMRAIASPGNELSASAWMTLATAALLRTVGPVLIATVVCASVASFLQVGPLMAWKRIQPDLSRLNPVQGFERIFSLNSLFTLVKVVLKATLLAAVVFYSIRAALEGAIRLGRAHPMKVLDVAGPLLLHVFGWACVVYLLISAADFAFQRFDFLRQQRMSFEDLRQEQRDTEGDPGTASRQRSVRMEAAFSLLPDRMRLADAVVYGPGVSVALVYLGATSLPVVVAKGHGEAAAQIRGLATLYLVAMAYDPALAEAIDRDTELDAPINRPHFEAVAALLRWASGQA